MKVLLRTLKYLVITIAILIALAAAIVILFDVNRLKPVLQNAAAEYGATLAIPGDISWQFYPNLGLKLGAMELSRADNQEQLATIESAGVSVKLLPLFQQQLRVNGIHLHAMQATYTIDASGQSNWQPILDALDTGEASQEPAADPAGNPDSAGYSEIPSLEINNISITDLALAYTNAQDNTQAKLRGANVAVGNVSLAGLPAEVAIDAQVEYAPYPPITLDWQGLIAVNLAEQSAEITNGKGQIDTQGKHLDITLSNSVSWAPPELQIKGDFGLQTNHLKGLLAALDMPLPETADPEVLEKVGLELSIDLQGDTISAEPIVLTLDETRLQGQLVIESFDTPRIVSQWHGTRMDLDRYLPPAANPDEPAAQAPETPAATPQPLPFEVLRNLLVEFQFDFEEVTVNKVAVLFPKIKLKAADGLITLQELSAEVAKGQIQGQGVLDARKNPATLDMTLDLQKMDVYELIQTQADFDHLSGSVTAAIDITSHGGTDVALTDNLVVQAQAQSQKLKLTPINIEQQFCRGLALLQQEPPPDHDWPEETLFDPIQLRAQYAGNRVTLESLEADLAHLGLKAQGDMAVESGNFDFALSLSLGDFGDTLPGCNQIKDSWRKHALPIRCKGNLETIGAKTCLPDEDILKDLLEDKAKRELKKERRKQEDDLKENARELLQKELGEEKAKEAEETLRGLFKKFKK